MGRVGGIVKCEKEIVKSLQTDRQSRKIRLKNL